MQPVSADLHGIALIVSGGQTGADYGALLAGVELSIGTGGYAPHNYMTGEGPCPALASFGLVEMPPGPEGAPPDWAGRDKKNAEMSDALVAFLYTAPMTGRGTERTINKFLVGEHRDGRAWGPVGLYELKGVGIDFQFVVRPHRKPVMIIYNLEPKKVEAAADLVQALLSMPDVPISHLMVSGPCQSTFATPAEFETLCHLPKSLDVQDLVKRVLVCALTPGSVIEGNRAQPTSTSTNED